MSADHALAVAAALGCALTWAGASVIFARVLRDHDGVDSHALNLINELFLALHTSYPEYLVEHFGMSTE